MKKKIYLFLGLLFCFLTIILIYKSKDSKLNGKNVKEEKLSIMIKEEGAEEYTKSSSKEIPKGDYTLNEEKTYCENNGEITSYDNVNGTIGFLFIGSDRCYLYFDYKGKNTLYKNIKNRYESNNEFVGLYTGEESDTYQNKVYYFKNDVKDNNVLFADFCWKMVRTTETGGVKLIYNGAQKDEYSTFQKFEESEYTVINNDENYPYVFDSTNKVWKSNNTDDSGAGNENIIEISADQSGIYQLEVLINNETEEDYLELYLNDEPIGYGENCSNGCFVIDDKDTIELNLNTSDILKLVYYKGSTTSDGTDYVQFNLQKGVGESVKSCNNTGTASQIGTSAYNSSYNSPAYVGYMYNSVYTYSKKAILSSSYFGGRKAYGNGVTYSSSKYTLTNTTILSVTNSNISTLVGKYTCNSSSTSATCKNVWYIVGYSGTTIYYYSLSDGTTDGTTLANKNYVFGSSFAYANGTYTLTDTATINSDNWFSQYINVNTHHYTCLSTSTTCSSLYYIYNIEMVDKIPIYIILTGGKSIDDVLNEMLYNANTKSSTNSTIKSYIDNWYSINMTSYTNLLEDTVFCNDRSMGNKETNGWYPNGGSTSNTLQFKNYNMPTMPSLKCTNENDKFTVDSSNGNGALTYPIGLLTAPEAKLANYGNYLNTGQSVWLGSPSSFHNYYSTVLTLYASDIKGADTNQLIGVRPVISLKPGTEIASGDGSYTSPFVIN